MNNKQVQVDVGSLSSLLFRRHIDRKKIIKREFHLLSCDCYCYIQFVSLAYLYLYKNIQIINIDMGNSQSQSSNTDHLSPHHRALHLEIDKFYTNQLTKHQFIHQLFSEMQSQQNGLIVNNTYILQRLYLVLGKQSHKQTINCAKLKNFVDKICKEPQKAIEKSFSLIDLDGDKYITNAQFLNYLDNCFISLLVAVEKTFKDHNFKLNFREWIMKNKKIFFDYILNIFEKFKRSDPQRWNYADFKRWVLSGENWTLDIQIAGKKYRTPLNLLCLFSIKYKSS